MVKEHTCINCQHLTLDEKSEKYFCKEFSPHNTTKENKTWVNWPETQSCGTEDIGYGTGKFLSRKSHARILKLKSLGI